MNYRLVSHYLGQFSFAIAVLILPAAAWALYFREWGPASNLPSGVGLGALEALLLSAAAAAIVGAILSILGRNAPKQLYQREALALVSISWFVAAAIGGLPYLFSGQLGPVDAYFEGMSGFTTTGATVITDIEATPKSILFWRSFTQWLGGMGIVVLFIAVLPYLGAGGKQLFKSEAPGPDPRSLRPRIRDTASILYKIYLGLTAAETVALMGAGLSFYDALTLTLSTAATGGFSTHQLSIAALDSAAVEAIIIFFMICGGMNFALFFAMLRRDWGAPVRDTEWRVFAFILVAATALISLNLMTAAKGNGAGPWETYSAGEAIRAASFQAVSIMTSTGFTTADFNAWPAFSRMMLVMLMIVGGCAGSTSGGVKVVRIIILVKMAYWRIEGTFRPKTIRAIRVSDHVVDDDVQKTVYAFFVIYVFCFIFGALFMSALGLPFETATTSVIASLSNIGPALELVGPSQDYAHVPWLGKLFLSLCMVLGRLELFSVAVLFLPSFWRHN